MGFRTVAEASAAERDGYTRISTWRKSPAQVTGAGIWFDLSMSPGNPAPQYYAAAPMVAKAMSQSEDGGMYHGQPVSPMTKQLRRFLGMTASAGAVPMPLQLLDYLLYYPFVDEGDTDVQSFVNVETLPRWTDGAGVQVMAVVVGGQTGGQSFYLRYTNSDGVPDRLTPNITMNAQAVTGTLVSSSPALVGGSSPFLPLAPGDRGVRSIEEVQMNGADVGLFTLVLVKPLSPASLRGIDAPVEIDYFMSMPALPVIQDDAYINAICCPMGSLSGAALHGAITTVWGD